MSNSEDITPNKTDRVRPHTDHRTATRRKRVALGAAVLVVAVALLCTVLFYAAKSSVRFVKNYFGPDENAAYFEKYLSPVVMFDPKCFSDIKEADSSWMLETAIWAAINENETTGTYATTSDGREILPAKDVTNYFEKYFGTADRPKYKTFTSGNFTYEYSAKEQCFYIPLVAVTDYKIPKVTKIDKQFDSVILTVGYISSENWGQDSSGNATAPTPEKTMLIDLEGSKGDFSIKSIEEDKTAEASSSKAGVSGIGTGEDDNTASSNDSNTASSSKTADK